MIQFAPPVRLPAKSAEALSADQRLHAVTLPLLFNKGTEMATCKWGLRLARHGVLLDGGRRLANSLCAEDLMLRFNVMKGFFGMAPSRGVGSALYDSYLARLRALGAGRVVGQDMCA